VPGCREALCSSIDALIDEIICMSEGQNHPVRKGIFLSKVAWWVVLAVSLALNVILCSVIFRGEDCGDFPDWKTSPYVLPFPKGKSYFLNQGNCSGQGHSGVYRYGYDFVMPIGSDVCAARGGVVFAIRDGFENGDLQPGHENWVKIRHEDGNISAYSHLSKGVLVHVGERVVAGQVVGKSGNSGNTGNLPHLHFHRSPCSEPVDCGTLPVTFSNTQANPKGLKSGRTYEAR